MYTIFKDYKFAAAHQIRGHTGGCENLHGHNYLVRVHVAAEQLDELGMVVDFSEIKSVLEEVVGPFDHQVINEIPPFDVVNTTAELLSSYFFDEVAKRLDDGRVRVTEVEVWENDSSSARFRRD